MMNRPRLIVLSVIGIVLLYAAGTWISNRTEWVEYTMPMPPKGEAATNPFYVAQRFAEQLGATTSWDRFFVEPSTDAVIVLSTWQWSMSAKRRQALERWVENGGRLVVDRGIWGGVEEFERWAGVHWWEVPSRDDDGSDEDEETEEGEEREPGEQIEEGEEGGSEEGAPADETTGEDDGDGTSADGDRGEDGVGLGHDVGEPDDEHLPWQPRCEVVFEDSRDASSGSGAMPRRTLCWTAEGEALRAKERVEWALQREEGGLHAVRVRLGRGSVTVINARPFRARGLFEGDHAWLLVAATQLKRGDEIHFLSEDEHPGLLSLAWMHGWPVIVLSGLLIALLLWRGAVRFGPLVAPPTQARRSLAEQIRGTGQFVMRGVGASALHAATVRALEEAVRKRVKGFGGLKGEARTTALASVIGDRARAEALAAALYDADAARASDLRRTLARIEAARRHVIGEDTRSSHGGAGHEGRH